LKTQIVVDKKTKRIICTSYSNGKRHDFRLFKESKTKIHPEISVVTDSGYQGLQKLHLKTQMPKKRSKKNPLTKEDKQNNQTLSRERVVNENVIGVLKRFKIIADRYRNRRKRFALRFNLLAGIYNWELNS
jgi:DDE superfamily endonuclease